MSGNAASSVRASRSASEHPFCRRSPPLLLLLPAGPVLSAAVVDPLLLDEPPPLADPVPAVVSGSGEAVVDPG